jgi:tetratricopeptide (TPR) repeat protein
MAEIEEALEVREHCDRASGFQREKNFAKAIAEYSEALKLLPNDDDTAGSGWDKAGVLLLRGSCYLASGEPEKAVEDYSKAISLQPEDGDYYNSRAEAYLALGEDEKAKADLEKAVELNPKEAARYYDNFGMAIEEQTGNKKEAAVYLKKSLEHGGYKYGDAKGFLAQWGIK